MQHIATGSKQFAIEYRHPILLSVRPPAGWFLLASNTRVALFNVKLICPQSGC